MTDLSTTRDNASRAAAPVQPLSEVLLNLLTRISLPALRMTLGLVYVWYGSLKIAGASPAATLVRDMVSVIGSPSWIVPVMGVVEVFIGLWLLSGQYMRYLLPLFVAHMLATLGVLVLLPGQAYQHHNPLELTMTGEFVTKNLVLLTAGVAVIGAAALRQRPGR